MDALESLFEWDVDLACLPQMQDGLRLRAEYPEAARRQAANMLRDGAADPALDGMLKDAGRTMGALSAAYLQATGAVTLARLRSLMSGFGVVSPGRTRALLNLMRHLGYIMPDPAASGGRETAYLLTPEFLVSYAQHEASLLEAIEVIEPAAGLVRRNLDRPGVLDTLVVEQAKAFTQTARQPRNYEAWWGVFLHRLAGIQILHLLVEAFGAFPPAGDIAFSVAATARRLKVSRMHVGRMMEDAQRHGFVELVGARLAFTPLGLEAIDWHYSSRFCVFLACAARTLKAHPELLGSARRPDCAPSPIQRLYA